jgi:hypothetical protein
VEKPEDEWNELEKQAYQQYLQKTKEQQEEREKLRKVTLFQFRSASFIFLVGFNCWINENTRTNTGKLSNIRTSSRTIVSTTSSGSNGSASSEKRCPFVWSIDLLLQEEMKISRLLFSMAKDRLIDRLERNYKHRAEQLNEKVQTLERSRRGLEEALTFVEHEKRRVRAEENAEKPFAREFGDVPSTSQEALKRLLTKRPRWIETIFTWAQPFDWFRVKGTKPSDDWNPYSGRQMRLLEMEIDRLQTEIDAFSNAPANLIRTVWDRFVDFRRKRINVEQEVSRWHWRELETPCTRGDSCIADRIQLDEGTQ